MSFDEFEPTVPAKTPPAADGAEAEQARGERRVPSSALDMSRFTPMDLTAEWALKGADTLELQGRQQPVLGRYVLIRKIAEGGMGAVYYGTHMHLGTEVAVKMLLPNMQAKQSELVDRFFREARLAAQIHSPHLVRVLDVARDETLGAHFLVMEYVEGESAGHWLERLRADTGSGGSERKALDTVIAGTKGLTAAHRQGVVHRDVKPANILVPGDPAGVLRFEDSKLSDLGLARPDTGERHLTDGQLALGTPGYMAPEQTKDATNVGKTADVFAMGATLYALLTGDSPFRGNTPFEMLRATVDGRYEALDAVRPDVSPATAAVVAQCLAKDPAARPADADALLALLEPCRAALEGGPESDTAVFPPVAPPTSTPPPSAAPAQATPTAPEPAPEPAPARRVSLLPVWVTVGVLAAFLGIVALMGLRAPQPEDAPPAVPDDVPVDPIDPQGEVGRVVKAFGEFVVNERTAQLTHGVPMPVEYGSDLSTHDAGIVFETLAGDRIDVGSDSGVRATRSAAGVETLVVKWGAVDAQLSARTHLSFLRFGTIEPLAGARARVKVEAPRDAGTAGRRVEALSGGVILGSRALSIAVPQGVAVTLFSDGGEDRRERELRFRSEGEPTREVRMRYRVGSGDLTVVVPAGSAGAITLEARARLRVLNAPDSPPGTAIRIESEGRGPRSSGVETRATLEPGSSTVVALRPGRGTRPGARDR